jgi:hypothetical protein
VCLPEHLPVSGSEPLRRGQDCGKQGGSRGDRAGARDFLCKNKGKACPNGRNPEIAGLLSTAVKLEFPAFEHHFGARRPARPCDKRALDADAEFPLFAELRRPLWLPARSEGKLVWVLPTLRTAPVHSAGGWARI